MLTLVNAFRHFSIQPSMTGIEQLVGVLNSTLSQLEFNARPSEAIKSGSPPPFSPLGILPQPFVTGFTPDDSAILSPQAITTLQQLFLTNLFFTNITTTVVLLHRSHPQHTASLPSSPAMDAEAILHFFHVNKALFSVFEPYSDLVTALTSMTNCEGEDRGAEDEYPSLKLPPSFGAFNVNVESWLRRLSQLTRFAFSAALSKELHENMDNETREGKEDRAAGQVLSHLVVDEMHPGFETSEEEVRVLEKQRTTGVTAAKKFIRLLGKKASSSHRLFALRYLEDMNPCSVYPNLFASHVVTFTGIGHQMMSNPGSLHCHDQFVKALTTYVHCLEEAETEYEEAQMMPLKKARRDVDSFERVKALVQEFDALGKKTLGRAWSEDWNAYEERKTQLLSALVTECGEHYIEGNRSLFALNDVVCTLRDPFNQLMQYLHVYVPVHASEESLVDVYYVHVIALVRKYYVYALQQIAVTIAVLCDNRKLGGRKRVM